MSLILEFGDNNNILKYGAESLGSSIGNLRKLENLEIVIRK